MNLNLLLNAVVIWIVVELATSIVTKTPLWLIKQCFSTYQRLWTETIYLYGILHNPNFVRWKPRLQLPKFEELSYFGSILFLIIVYVFYGWLFYLLFTSPLACVTVVILYFVVASYITPHYERHIQKYVSLNVIKAYEQSEESPESVISFLRSSAKKERAIVLLGEPGAGKTTALEALTYRVGRNAYTYNMLIWFILESVALLLLFINPTFSLIWLASYLLWEKIIRRSTVPIYVALRSEYFGGSIHDWCNQILQRYAGDISLKNRVILMLDGVNEIQADSYESFTEGWRAIIRNQKNIQQVIFTSRINEDPSLRLGIEYKLTVCELDDDGVELFLRVYGQEKAALKKKKYKPEQATYDFDLLQNKNLLGKDGIGRNPYWLRIMVEGDLYTRNLGALFLNFTKKLILRETEEKPEKRKRRPEWKNVPIEIEMKSLASLALAMHRKQQIGFNDKKGWYIAHDILRSVELEYTEYTSNDILRESEASSLLRAEYEKQIVFTHQLVQEFFTAYALQEEDKWKEAAEYSNNIWWGSTLAMLGGLLALNSPQQTFTDFAKYTLRDGKDEIRILNATKILGSVDDVPADLMEFVLEAFIASLEITLTEIQYITVNEFEKLLKNGFLDYCDNLLHKPDKQVKVRGATILCAIGTEEAAETLLNWLEKTNVNIEFLLPIGEPLIKILITALTDSSKSVDTNYRKKAANRLKQIGTPAIKMLKIKTESSDEWVSENSKVALAMIEEGVIVS